MIFFNIWSFSKKNILWENRFKFSKLIYFQYYFCKSNYPLNKIYYSTHWSVIYWWCSYKNFDLKFLLVNELRPVLYIFLFYAWFKLMGICLKVGLLFFFSKQDIRLCILRRPFPSSFHHFNVSDNFNASIRLLIYIFIIGWDMTPLWQQW